MMSIVTVITIPNTRIARADFNQVYLDSPEWSIEHEQWRKHVSHPMDVTVVDARGTGEKSIFVAKKTLDPNDLSVVIDCGVYEYSLSGTLLHEFRVPVDYAIDWVPQSTPSIGDVDGDGENEIVIAIRQVAVLQPPVRIIVFNINQERSRPCATTDGLRPSGLP